MKCIHGLEDFTQAYYNTVFNGQTKTVSVENWVGGTYKITLNNNALATGIYDESNQIQDYITVVSDGEGNYKLNINSYIGRRESEASTQYNNIEIRVTRIDTYMDYQEYTFNVINRSDKTINLDEGITLDSMYIQDENDIQYTAYTHEITDAQKTIYPNEERELSIRYYSEYQSDKVITDIVFSRVIMDYGAYQNVTTKANYRDYGIIQITL